MAATLPPISKNKSSALREKNKDTFKPLASYVLNSKKEKTHELPILRKRDIAKFRNSHKHNLCLDMLTEGFHMSFCELVNLIRQQSERRKEAGPESLLWNQPVLENQPEKIDRLKFFLTKAEYAGRLGNNDEEYKARFSLAQSFQTDPNDQWLVDHFFNTCLDIAKRDGQETKQLAEAYCNVGLCLQINENYKEAVKLFEVYHRLAKENMDWKLANGSTLYIDSCVKLYDIYTIFGLQLGRSSLKEDSKASLVMLKQALEMAKSSGDEKLQGEASYALGMAYQKANKLDVAFSHLLTFSEYCQRGSDNEGTGRACDAIAKNYARQGNKEKSVEFLKKFVELTEKTGLEKEYCLACHNMGYVCNTVGNYNEATEYFNKAYNISRALGDPQSTNINRVQYGIGMAHRMLEKYANHIAIGDRICMNRLLDWKCVRTDDFKNQIPDAAPEAAYHVMLPPPPEESIVGSEANQEETTEEDEYLLKEDGEGLWNATITE